MTTPARRAPVLALELGGGAHPAAPRDAARPVRAWAAAAEAAGYTLATLSDSPLHPGPEAGVTAAHLALATDRIGLAPTLHATTTEPFHLATQLASLDHASHGRGAWIVGATNGADDLATIGRTPLTAQALRQETGDVVRTARALWDSWEDDAVVKSIATSRFLDAAKVHHVDFEGDSFSVKGP
ncbi:LLM class flavin-dependent oxidoreductase [Streptacidiphilus monticola]